VPWRGSWTRSCNLHQENTMPECEVKNVMCGDCTSSIAGVLRKPDATTWVEFDRLASRVCVPGDLHALTEEALR
jgi:hypothetical protein